jgi:hypothetical protein|tara:strand:+ start:324 stop:728 length:405 start_codon:yes stop_codon:yes gene_type:complete
MSEQVQLDLFLTFVEKDTTGKVCIWCDTHKPMLDFGLYNRNADGRDNRCRKCISHSTGIIAMLRKYAPEKPEVCECCLKPPKKKFVLDHCHQGEVFRGWLCDHCNLAIGMLGDNITGIEKALAYLKKHERLKDD